MIIGKEVEYLDEGVAHRRGIPQIRPPDPGHKVKGATPRSRHAMQGASAARHGSVGAVNIRRELQQVDERIRDVRHKAPTDV
jgi:hypothetical protein